MSKKWISMLLAIMMLLCLSVPVFAAGELEAPPQAEVMEEAPQAEEAPPVAVEIEPAEDTVTEDATGEETVVEEAPVEEVSNDNPMPISAGGVTVSITGALEGIKYAVMYVSPDGSKTYFAEDGGIYYCDDNLNKHWVEYTNGRPTQFAMYPGGDIQLKLWPGFNATFNNATVKEDYIDSWYGGGDAFAATHYVTATAPVAGTITVNITSDRSTTDMPKLVNFTFYNDTPDVVVGGEDWGSSSPDMKTLDDGSVQWKVNTGGEFSKWVAPGYAIEVLKGGYVAKTEAPSGPAAASVPAGSTSYVLHVDLEADEFVIAAVKQGESFQAPDANASQGETPPAADTTTQTDGTFTDVDSDLWYAAPIEKAYSSGIVKGITDTTFSPNGATTRGQTVTMLYRAAGSPSAGAVFSDTSGEVASAAGWASANGVTTGVSATAFAPNISITREQLVTMLYRMAGSPAVSSTDDLYMYTDGNLVQSYARNAVAWALSNGLLNGYGDGSLKPTGAATRAEVCTLIMRFLGVA